MAKLPAFLCTGSSGLIASAVKAAVKQQDFPFFGIDLRGEEQPVNILVKEELDKVISSLIDSVSREKYQPVLFHFAAVTFTGFNLTQEQVDLSWKLNVEGTHNVVEMCAHHHIPLVHISTDFVFSGCTKSTPYLPEDSICPDTTVYSQTKAKAEEIVMRAKNEQMVVILRLAFPYGNPHHSKPGLDKKMMNWMDTKPEVNLYSDQNICPTPISYIAKACVKTAQLIVENNISSGKILHVVGQPTTPYAFSVLVKNIFEKNVVLKEASVEGKGTKNFVLDTTDTEKILGITAPSHEEELCKLQAERA